MKKFFLFLLFLIILVGVVNAQEKEAKYNFGSAQGAKELTISPGDEISTKLYFYNIFGNRNTHIALSVGDVPENWDVSIEPALHKITVSVSGVSTIIEENLYLRPPSDVADTIPDDIPEGIEYISSSVGFIGAKPVLIKIQVPDDEKLGTVAKITIEAVASWLGQSGTAAITQSRSFDYTITVASKEFTEEIIGNELLGNEQDINDLESSRDKLGSGNKLSQLTGSSGIMLLLVIIIALLIFLLIRKK